MAKKFRKYKTGISTVFERTKTDPDQTFKEVFIKDEKNLRKKTSIS